MSGLDQTYRNKWAGVAEDLRDRIISGEFPEGSLLPSATILMDEYGIGRASVNKARAFLRREGLIRTGRPGPHRVPSVRCTVIYSKEQAMSDKSVQVFTNDAEHWEDSNEYVWAGFLIEGVMHWVQNYDVCAEESPYPGHTPLIVCMASELAEKPAPDVVVPVRS
ncbi:winged helix-turn-helix domain-containing protein [Streptomyces arboris]|uniref:winged helix-turn-helix domain-containing protein n=1 Tax=Streptomyces arboris TaxID=2600619 RepID=UPI003BF56A31